MIILGTKLNDNKSILYEMIKIYGIGITTSKKLCNDLNINYNRKINTLTSEEVINITSYLRNMTIGSDLKFIVKNNISRLISIGSYRGLRHTSGLSVRGQSTRSNAKTVKRLKMNLFK